MILVGGQQPGDIWFVILGITATTVISLYAVPPGQWLFHPLGVVRFLPYFLLTALRGGWDVARRVFFRTIPIDPDFITIPHDEDQRKTLLLAWIISLLPGTASCVIREETIVVHVLDKKLPVTEEILELQKRINEMFA
ncbi:MAG: Na+/H+ antiporter subunit E, partial [Dethiobacteria bacterium]